MASNDDFRDFYKETTLKQGNECSKILAEFTTPTLENHPDIRFVQSGMNHIAVIAPRKDNIYYGFSVAGDPKETDMQMYVKKLIESGVNTALNYGLTPIGFADVIDASRADVDLARLIGNVMAEESYRYKKQLGHKLAVLNGEYAHLKGVVTSDANMNLAMVCRVTDPIKVIQKQEFHSIIPDQLVGFNPRGDFIYANSDGVGTKHLLYSLAELLGEFGYQEHMAVIDGIEMQRADLVKINANAKMTINTLEHNGSLSVEKAQRFKKLAKQIMAQDGGISIINYHDVGNNLRGYDDDMSATNFSGSSLSTISERNLSHLPKPVPGNYVMSFRAASASNPDELGPDGWRSNGISSLREIPFNKLGKDWYKTPEGKEILKYAITPSDNFYTIFKRLFDEDVISAGVHLSGGSYNEKLARYLAKENLFLSLTADQSDKYPLWPVSDIVKKVIDMSGMPPSSFYNKWVMSNPGFVFTDYPEAVTDIAKKYGYLTRKVGIVKAAIEAKDGRPAIRPGVSIRTYTGEDIFFDGT